MTTDIVVPKEPCPRDMGIFYCQDCRDQAAEESSNLDFNVTPIGCGKEVDGKICGETHLGYSWCKECTAKGTFVPNPHFNQFDIVGRIEDA